MYDFSIFKIFRSDSRFRIYLALILFYFILGTLWAKYYISEALDIGYLVLYIYIYIYIYIHMKSWLSITLQDLTVLIVTR